MGQLVFQATLGGQVNLVGPNTASTFNINVPATSGNMVTTGDTGTVTATMLASTTGSGAVVLATSPTLVTPALGTPSALVGTNITGTAAGLSIGGNAATATTATNVSGGTSSVTSETVSGNLTLSGGTANGVAYLNGSKVVTTGSALVFDGTNFGVGVTPSAWNTFNAIQMLGGGVSIASGSGQSYMGSNWYFASGNKYYANGYATRYDQTSGTHAWQIAPSGTAGNAITFTQAMTLDASGNLVVGGTSAVYTNANRGNITINGTSTALLALSTGGTGRAYLYTDGSRLDLLNTQNDALTFGTNNTERARIDSSGNLLVGQTSTGYLNGSAVAIEKSTYGRVLISHASGSVSGSYYLGFALAGAEIGSITQSGTTAVLYNVTSDQRLKEYITDAAPASALIDAIQVRQYNWKSDGSFQRYGFIAQELVTVAPEAVHQPADPEKMMAVDYSKLVPMLVKEIQDLRKRLATAGI